MNHITTATVSEVTKVAAMRWNFLVPPQEEKMLSLPATTQPLFQRGVDFVRERLAAMPLDLSPDADLQRDRAICESVRAGFVDDIGIDEGRRVY